MQDDYTTLEDVVRAQYANVFLDSQDTRKASRDI